MDRKLRRTDGSSARRCSLWRLVMSALMLLAVSFPATSAGGSKTARQNLAPAVELFTSHAATRGVVEVAVDARSNRFCALSLFQGRHFTRAVVRASKRHVKWRWVVASDASPGQWNVGISCARSRRGATSSGARRVARVLSIAPGHGRGPLVARHSLGTTFSPHASRTTSTPAPPAAGTSSGAKVAIESAVVRNPFAFGQCTYHAYETRPDVFDIAVSRGVARGLASAGDYWWDAWRWLGNAQTAGIATGRTPVAGALVVFPRGYGGSSIGHVAYVKRVDRDGSYLISERNWNHKHAITTRVIHPGYGGIRFIYGGPAGNGR